jgi:hypothetical protein
MKEKEKGINKFYKRLGASSKPFTFYELFIFFRIFFQGIFCPLITNLIDA